MPPHLARTLVVSSPDTLIIPYQSSPAFLLFPSVFFNCPLLSSVPIPTESLSFTLIVSLTYQLTISTFVTLTLIPHQVWFNCHMNFSTEMLILKFFNTFFFPNFFFLFCSLLYLMTPYAPFKLPQKSGNNIGPSL